MFVVLVEGACPRGLPAFDVFGRGQVDMIGMPTLLAGAYLHHA